MTLCLLGHTYTAEDVNQACPYCLEDDQKNIMYSGGDYLPRHRNIDSREVRLHHDQFIGDEPSRRAIANRSSGGRDATGSECRGGGTRGSGGRDRGTRGGGGRGSRGSGGRGARGSVGRGRGARRRHGTSTNTRKNSGANGYPFCHI